MLVFIIWLVVFGLIAGAIARFLVPGNDSMGVGATVVLGIVGSFIGGFLAWAVWGTDFENGALQPSGIVGSIIGAIVALLVYNLARRGRLTR